MRFIETLTGIAILTASAAASDGTVKFDMRRRQASSSQHTLGRPLPFNAHWIAEGGYFIDVDIGTPPQHFTVLLDTGSSNLFVASSDADPCQRFNCPGGSFNISASSTYSVVEEPVPFNISYADGSLVVGNYSSDVVSLGDANLTNVTFGVAPQIQVSLHDGPDAPQYGILGISFDAAETGACYNPNGDTTCQAEFTFPTVPDALKSAGYIDSVSYSFYLDSLEESKGSILFGGIDTAKFVGSLDTLAMQPDLTGGPQNGTYDSVNVILTSLSGTIGGNTTQFTTEKYAQSVTIDSGTAGLQVPSPIYNAVYSSIGPAFVIGSDNVIPCKYANDKTTYLTFGFTGQDDTTTSIDVPLWAFMVPYYGNGTYNATEQVVQNGDLICKLTLTEAADGAPTTPILLGDPLFRAAYIYFNLEEKTISFAQAVYGTDASNITAIGAGPVPSLTGTGDPGSSWNSTAPAYPQGNGTSSAPPSTSSGAYSAGGKYSLSFMMALVVCLSWSSLA